MDKTLSFEEEILKKLVEFQSVSGDISAAQELLDYIEQQLAEYKLHIRKFSDDGYPILLATTRKTLAPKTLLVSHADVLAAPDDMFTMTVDKDKLYGRGVWDMKFAIAGYLGLLRKLDNVTKYDFGILITSDEETRHNNVTYVLENGVSAQNVVLLDGASNWQLESLAKGAWTVRISVNGRAAHGSRPWEGESASLLLLHLLQEIKSWFPSQGHQDNTLNISQLSAGQAVNQLPINASAVLDMRFVSRKEEKKIQSKLSELTRNNKATLDTLVHIPVVSHNLSNHYLKTFSDSVAEHIPLSKEGLLSFGASEAARFIDRDIPCIVTRPIGGGHHSNDEWIDRKSFALLVPILMSYLERLN